MTGGRSTERISWARRMTKLKLGAWVPTEWTSGRKVLRVMGQHRAASASLRGDLVGFALPFLVGCTLGALFAGRMQTLDSPDGLFAILAGVMAVGALVAGFMLSMMLAAGVPPHVDQLSPELVDAYGDRLRSLMYSQACTMVSAVLAAVCALAWLIASGGDVEVIAEEPLGGLTGAYLAVCLIRCVLIPLQIYEVNDSALADAVDASRKRTRAEFAARSRADAQP
jgi:MFS family permease